MRELFQLARTLRMRVWVAAINDAQECRRRDRHFLPLSVVTELLQQQQRLTEDANVLLNFDIFNV